MPKLGYKHTKKYSKERCLKISLALKGKKKSLEHRLKMSQSRIGRIPWNKGIPMRHTTKIRLSESLKGRKGWNKGKRTPDEVREKQRISKLNKPSKYWLGKKRLDMTGENHFAWKGGVSKERTKAYLSLEYKTWRESVFKRDNYTCQKCGAYGVEINADHIIRWVDSKQFRYELSNGMTLCVPCHRIKTKEELGKNHRNQFKSWKK